VAFRKDAGSDSRRTLADASESSPLAGLIDALRAEKTRFIVVGMTGAVLQGTPVTTFDVDLWIDLPPRHYIRMINLARALGGQILANTVVVLPGDITVNFIYEMAGLASFETEVRRARQLTWLGRKVSVLPLERIHVSKKFAGRPKDIAHLPILEQTMRLGRRIRRKAGADD
jgi:hypothetical protein